LVFDDYPIDKFALIAAVFNPIDLSRILILLKLEISALFGYTEATFKMFLGTNLGMFASTFILTL
jgi:Cu-processing system permease protein